ncbi:MAG: septum formation initiator family protein [Patescibacteria group bacterium]
MKRIFLPLVFGAVLVAALGILAYKLYNASYEKYQITKKSSNIQEEIDALKAKNEGLEAMVERLEDRSYAEKEARKRLNVQKEGETTVILARPGSASNTAMEETSATSSRSTISNNISHWRATLFGN